MSIAGLVVGEFTFDPARQSAFARLTGDWNPIHVDADYARRSSFGQPVVHGMNTLLAALDLCCGSGTPLLDAQALSGARITAQFVQPAFLTETLRLIVVSRDAKRLRLSVRAGTAELVRIAVTIGDGRRRPVEMPIDGNPVRDVPGGLSPRAPDHRSIDQGTNLTVLIPVAVPAAELRRAYPALQRVIGPRAVTSIALLSTAVGMHWPGLQSLFAEAKVSLRASADHEPHALALRVLTADPRHRLTTVAVTGSEIDAELVAFFRPEPVAQPRLEHLRSRVEAGRFRAWTAVVVGGSRGLGELSAKIAALGGAEVILTYHASKTQAEAVRDEIRAGGGSCTLLPYDAASGSLNLAAAARPDSPLFLFYSASPHIFRRRTNSFDRKWLNEFLAIFVDGFVQVLEEVRSFSKGPLSVVYPSTEALDKPFAQIVEYAAAKAAGEAVCRALAAGDRRLRVAVPRLPRLLTDQTNTVVSVETADPVDILLPILLEAMSDGCQGG